MKNLISCDQFTKENLKELFDLADVVRANPEKYMKLPESMRNRLSSWSR